MYADSVTPSMEKAIRETLRRRKIQMDYNKANGIVPKTIVKDVADVLEISTKEDIINKVGNKKLNKTEKEKMILALTKEMKKASKMLEFEYAAVLRDRIESIKRSQDKN